MRFFLSILGVIIFIVLVIVIIAHSSSSKIMQHPINLDSYNYNGSSVTQTTTGELVGDNQRQATRIVITQSQRTIELLGGYNQTIVGSESFPNNSAAYDAFLGALQNADYATSRTTTETNMFGVCPLGSTFQYQLSSSTKTVSNLWSTSCNFSDGTFAGNGPLIRQLFSLQIPNYTPFTQNQTTIVDATN